MGISGDKAVLRQIDCFFAVPDQSADETVDRLSMPIQDFGEGSLAARQRKRRKLSVGTGSKVDAHRTSAVNA